MIKQNPTESWLISYHKVEGCLEGNNVWDIILSENIETDLLAHLKKLGKFIISSNEVFPYFVIIVRGQYTLKSTLGKNTIRVLLPENADAIDVQKILDYIGLHFR